MGAYSRVSAYSRVDAHSHLGWALILGWVLILGWALIRGLCLFEALRYSLIKASLVQQVFVYLFCLIRCSLLKSIMPGQYMGSCQLSVSYLNKKSCFLLQAKEWKRCLLGRCGNRPLFQNKKRKKLLYKNIACDSASISL